MDMDNFIHHVGKGFSNLWTKNSALGMGKAFVVGSAGCLLGGFSKSYKHAAQVGAIAVLASAISYSMNPYINSKVEKLNNIAVFEKDSKKKEAAYAKANTYSGIAHSVKTATSLILSMYVAQRLGLNVNMRQTIAKYSIIYIISNLVPGSLPMVPTYGPHI